MRVYQKIDVHQLADIFESLRNEAIEDDGLDPAHYFTLPGLGWDSALKRSGVTIDLLPEEEMYKFIESAIRGGMTFCNRHYTRVNSPDVDQENYDPTKPVLELLYVDANNLYGKSLSEPLPCNEPRWMTQEECNLFLDKNWLLSQDFIKSLQGYTIQVDLEYPAAIHDATVDLPFAPEKMKLSFNHLSEFMKNHEGSKKRQDFKLLLNQWDKTDYTVHCRLLQFFVKNGMKVTRVHRGLTYMQAPIFKGYIDYNSQKRQEATAEFKKDFFKLKNNSLFGKSQENKRKRLNFRPANTEEQFRKYASNPSFNYFVRFNEDLVGCQLQQEKIVLDKPVFIGQAVLDLSKLEMYELFYERIQSYERRLDCKIRLVGGDTDSFFMEVIGCSVYKELLPLMKSDGLLDGSKYPKNHPLFSNENKAKLGCIKDEGCGDEYLEWVLLRPKAYSMLTKNMKAQKKAKGVKKATIKKVINHSDFVKAYEESRELYYTQRRIASRLHHMETLTFSKKSLSSADSKRYWVNHNDSLPFGHYSLDQSRPELKKQVDHIPQHEQPEEPLAKIARFE